MALSLSECEFIVRELRKALVGGFVQKIHQPRNLTLTLDIRAQGQTSHLLVCVEPRFARLHLTSQKFENPPTPPPFCAFLRSHVEGGRIAEISQEPGDRIVFITIAKVEQMSVLVIALTGNQANVHVLNEKKLVLRSLRDSRVKMGERYTPPTLRPGPSQEALSPSAMEGRNSPDQIVNTQDGKVGEPLSGAPTQGPDTFGEMFPVSAELEARYRQREEEEGRDTILEQQLIQARKALKHAKRKIQALQEDFKKTERFREYARYGELLKGHLHEINKGQETITMVDYYDPALPTLTLPLDPAKDAVWNMEDYFRKYHKYIGAQEHLQPRVDEAHKEVARLEGKLAQLEQGIVDPEGLPKTKNKTDSSIPQGTRVSKGRPVPAQGYRTYTSADGLPILVGKTAKDNDHLTLKVANPDDLWLHARGTPGSHVVVRLEKGATVPPETLKDAATLTLWFSDLRKSGKGEVIYTLRKFVRKGKGFKPGSVTVEREKSLWIELQEDRLNRLKGGTN
ncbi:Rqc2 family fibronectin-binding protein [Candidatus Nitrospira neomarina]|uniref:NFACT family protein n=1 Tax=Candidatus Nitrospira neomarina TaxID=3020899 RepID=A0AA96GPU9_9BACT|nr:NFACT family protein [Candidatus Nitrospira neomarina]WNM63168.1 NFACT family protein [Candidatus Nitrospira neomarina]